MKIRKTKEYVEATIENKNDLWYLSTIIEKGDKVSGKTLRKIKIGEGTDRNLKVTKKAVFLKIEVDKVDYSPEILRVGGQIIEGPEDIPRGSHHSFNLEEGKQIRIIKEKWLKYQEDKLKEACEDAGAPLLMCVFDREEAYFATLSNKGCDIVGNIKGNVAKKADVQIKSSNFYSEIIKQLEGYAERYKCEQIIVASPSFWKDEFMKELKNDDLKKKITLASCSSVGRTSFDELVKREEVKSAIRDQRFAKEINKVEKLLREVSKGELAAYGLDDVKKAVDAGAAAELMVTDGFIKKAREDGNYDDVESLLKNTEAMKGEVIIISSEHGGGQKLEGIGGIGAVLRYRI